MGVRIIYGLLFGNCNTKKKLESVKVKSIIQSSLELQRFSVHLQVRFV